MRSQIGFKTFSGGGPLAPLKERGFNLPLILSPPPSLFLPLGSRLQLPVPPPPATSPGPALQLECLFSLGVRVIANISDAHKLQCSGINYQSSHLDFDKRSKSDAFKKTCYHSFLFGRFESLMSGLKSRNKILQILQNWS